MTQKAIHTTRKIKDAIIILGVLLLLMGIYALIFTHTAREDVLAARTRVEAISYYEVTENGKVVLEFDRDTITGNGYFINQYHYLPSCKGKLWVNIDSTIWGNKYKGQDVAALLTNQIDSLDSVYRDAKWRVSELSYYLHSHQVMDEGYNMISDYTQKEVLMRDSAKKMLDSLSHIKSKKHLKITAKKQLVAIYTVINKENGKRKTYRETANRLSSHVFQLQSKQLPASSHAISKRMAEALASLDIEPLPKVVNLCYQLDSVSNYIGSVDSIGRPCGHGILLDTKGTYYEGNWKAGQRDGFGYSIAPHKPLRAGEWKNDCYKGERLVYTSDRIYGIDISKYQHIIGKKKYAINWNQLRITHLGNISKKTISGQVNFPIHFIYVKSTEGATLLNPYYRQDYLAARARGFKVGSYHFFSPLSSATLQAKQFLKHTFIKKGDFPPVLDVEPTGEQIKKMGGANVLFARVRTWLRIVERDTGIKPILYISQGFVNRYLGMAPDLKHNYKIWIARYGEYKPDIHLIYWQLCPDGRVAGIHGHVDINVFNGYKDAYDKFVKECAL